MMMMIIMIMIIMMMMMMMTMMMMMVTMTARKKVRFVLLKGTYTRKREGFQDLHARPTCAPRPAMAWKWFNYISGLGFRVSGLGFRV